MVRRMNEQANVSLPDHFRSIVGLMWHLGNCEHFGCIGQRFLPVGTILSVVTMRKNVHLPKVVAILAAERASSCFPFDKSVTGKIRWRDIYNTGPNIDRKSILLQDVVMHEGSLPPRHGCYGCLKFLSL